STPPYTSWQTAADSIQKCINICSFGDTVYVANGVYKEQVIMIQGLSLIGAGMDSCVINTRDLSGPWPFMSVSINDTCILSGFKIIVSSNPVDQWGIGDSGSTGSSIIQNRITRSGVGVAVNNLNLNNNSNLFISQNIIDSIDLGIYIFNSNAIISENNIHIYHIEGRGIDIGAFDFTYKPIIKSNYIETIARGIVKSFGSNPTISNNVIKLKNAQTGIFLSYSDSAKVFNNLIIGDNIVEGLYNTSVPNLILDNNYFYGSSLDRPIYQAMQIGPGNSAKNNVIENSVRGVYNAGIIDPEFKYNNLWNTQTKYDNFTGDSTNISVDPMIINADTTEGELDFHLQKFSPLIDSGDPTLIDIDSSRIDIGLYGGLLGEIYTFNDLAPRAPKNLSAVVDSNTILVKWNKNTEADTSYYKVYRDTVSGFTIDSTKLVSSSADTFFVQINPQNVTRFVYRVSCVDNQGNESAPSEEKVVNLTGIDNYPHLVTDYQLYQNYPNPFNPATTIGYRLKERGYVKLYVYDIKGELVNVLVNKEQETGFYEVKFDIGNKLQSVPNLASGVYIYHLMVKGENNIPVFSDIKKMIYIK
ncbi:MAG: hypothetical protein WA440_01965, partial [Ignavibacteriaceae bacterium]